MEQRRVFDGIRGVAFFIVLVIHAVALGIDQAHQYVQGTAKFGVWLFFVLSSFLLTHNYVEPAASKTDFALGRVLRIVPLYYLACLIYGMAGVVVTARDIPMIAAVLYGELHLWTIPVEFYFYALLFLLWTVPRTGARDAIFAAAAVISTSLLLALDKPHSSTNTLWYLPAFFVGYALARIWPKLPKINYGTTLCILVLCVLASLSPGILHLIGGITPTPYLMNWYLPISVLWAIFIFAAANSDGWAHKILSGPAPAWLGKVSYSGYLFHWIVLIYAVKFVGQGWMSVVVGVGASIVIASFSYAVAERPLIRLRKKLQFSFRIAPATT